MKTKSPLLHIDRLLLALAIVATLLAPQLRAQSESTNTNDTSYIQPLWGGLVVSYSTNTGATEPTTSYTIGDGDTGGTLSFGGSSESNFQAMSSGIPLEGTPGTASSFATTTINFDTAGNWTQGSAALGSYATNHVYVESGWTFTGGPALRNGTAAQDGFAGALGTYSWRLRDAAGVVWTGTYNTGGTLSAFGFDVRRWDGSPDPSFSIDYSVDGGTSFTSTGTTINNAFLNNSSDWTTFSFSLLSPTTVAADDFIVRVSRLNGERIMIDNFSYTTASAAFTTWTGTGSGGTWSDGTAGNFGGNYANSLANTVTLTGTGETIATSGTPQAGSLTFNSDSYVITGALQLGVGTVTVTTAGQTATISANISGDGGSGLTKEGAGNLVLSGSNNYTGAAAINAGTLEMQSADALGTTALGTDVGSGATLALSGGITTAAEALTLAGTGVSGGGALRSLSGNNTYSGAITLDGAARINSDAGTLTLDVAAGNGISGNFGLTFGGAGNIVVSDAIATSGGSLTKDGAGTLTLLGANTYSGGTLISAGEVIGSTTSLQGNITNNATMTFDQSGSGTYAGAISGSGTLVKENTGTVILTGNNSQTTGGTLVIDGTLQIGNGGTAGSLAGTIDNDGTLIFNRSDSITQSAVISGTGAVTKQGAGTLTMSAVNTFSGATTVSAGELVVNGTNASSAVTVSSGAALSGSGQVGGLSVSGLLSPGNSIGTLSAGNTTFAADGAFQLEMFDWTSSAGTGWDLLAITGDLTVSSTSLNPFTIDLVSFSDATTPGFSVNFNANQSFTNTFVTYSGSLTGFATNLFVVDTTGFQNSINGTFSITNVSGGLALLYTTSFDPGASYVWNAGSGDWTVAGNWEGNAAPVNDSLLVFSGAAGAATNNAAVTSVTGLKFSNTTGSIVLAGDAFALGEGGIENDSANVHTISNNISLATNASILSVSNGLIIAGNITNDTASQVLTVGGGENTTISGAVSGQGDLSKIGLGTLTLSGANTFTGSFAVNGGEAIVSGTAATTTIAINVGGTLSLGAADALADGGTVTVDAGTFNTATFNDTIGTLVLTNGGTVSGTGVLGATTFTLGGGTVSGALGAGTANVTGEVSLTGTMDSTTINVNTGGTLTLGSADRLGDGTAVTIGGGTLAMGANNDTVGTFSITSGTLGGTGTLTAATYSLGGGTLDANLGAGTATAASGSTALNGTLGADLTVSGGTVTAGAADRISDTASISITSGTLNLGGFTDTVGSFSITDGEFASGTLTAATYALGGGTVSGNLGAGAASVSSGSTTLSGTLAAGTLIIDGGTLVLGGNGRIDNATAVTLSSGTLDTSTFSDGVGSFTMTGGTLAGTGALSSSTYTLNGGTIDGVLGSGAATAASGTTTVNGTINADLTVSGATVDLTAADRLADSSDLAISSGTLGLGVNNDTVGSFSITGGTLGGSGMLTAATYSLGGGTVTANLGAGTATASNGTTALDGTLAGDLNVAGGTVNLGSSDRLGNTSTVTVSSGTLAVGANTDTVGTLAVNGGTVSGNGTITATAFTAQGGSIETVLAGTGATFSKSGAGSVTLSAANTFDGGSTISGGAVVAANAAALGSGSISMTGDGASLLASENISIANNIVASALVYGGMIISEYVEGSSSNKYIEIYNGTGATISLGDYQLVLYANGSATPGNTSILGSLGAGSTLAHGETLVLKNSSAALTLPTGVTAYNSSAVNFNGDDALALQFTNGTNIDIFGVIGNDPGTSWTAGSLSTVNQTLARDSDVLYGVSNNPIGTGPSGFATLGTEWTGFPIDTVSNLGSHTMNFLPGSVTIGSETENATVTYSGTVSLDSSAVLTAATGGSTTFSGAISGTNGITKAGAGTVTLSAANTYSGGTTISAGVLAVGAGSTTGSISGNVVNNATLQFNRSDDLGFSGAISGTGAVTKLGAGTLTLSGAGSYSGATTVSAGTLELADTDGAAAGSTASISVASGATLLLSQSDQVSNSASVTLSGGTITRGTGVSEVFGSLNLTQASFLDFGTGATGNLTFGTYQNNETPSALLTLNNFLPGNSFTFNSTSFTEGSINSYFSFGTGYVNSSITNTGSTFTITAIPEPSTYLAAAGLLSLMLWPSRKRLLKDAKKIFGLTLPMRDRLAKARQ